MRLQGSLFALAAISALFSLPAGLAAGKLDALFDGVVIKAFEEIEFDLNVGAIDIKVVLRDMVCSDMGVGSISFLPVNGSDHRTSRGLEAQITDFDITCSVEISAFVKLNGNLNLISAEPLDVQMELNARQLEIDVMFLGSNLLQSAPSTAELTSCTLDVETTLSVETGPLAVLEDELNSALHEYIIETSMICDLMKDIIAKPFTVLSGELSEWVRVYQEMGSFLVDRLAAEKSIAEKDLAWVNFEESAIFQMAFEAFNSEFSVALDHNKTISAGNSASELVRMVTVGRDGVYQIIDEELVLFEESSEAFTMEIIMTDLKLIGLDSVVEFSPVHVYGEQTLESNITLANLRAEANFTLSINALFDEHEGIEGFSLKKEPFQVTLGLTDTELNLAFMLAIDSERAWDLEFGSTLKNPFDCVLTTFDQFQATRVWANTSGLSSHPQVEGLLSNDFTKLVQSVVVAILHIYGPSGMRTIPGLILEHGPRLVTDGFGTLIQNSDCPLPPPYVEEPFFDFSTASYFQDLVEVVETDVVPNINKGYISPFTEDQSGHVGKYILQEDKKMAGLTIGPIGRFEVSAAEISISGLDSVHDVKFMETYAPYVLHNSFALGGALESGNPQRRELNESGELPPVVLSLVIEINFDGHEKSFRNKFEFSIAFEEFRASLDFLAMVNRTDFDRLTIKEILNFDCILSRLDTAEILNLHAGFNAAKVSLRCVECTSPGMLEMEEKVRIQDANDEFTDVLNDWIATILKRMKTKFDDAHLSDFIEKSRGKCEGTYKNRQKSGFYPESSSRLNVFAIIGGMAAAIFVGLIIGFCLHLGPKMLCLAPCYAVARCMRKSRICHNRKRRSSSDTSATSVSSWTRRFHRFSSGDSADIMFNIDELPIAAASPSQHMASRDTTIDLLLRNAKQKASLGFHPATPKFFRYGVLAALCLNAFLFVIGHLAIAANINLVFHVLGDKILMSDVAGFSIGKSIKDLWNAGIIPLALLIAGLSGAFPYVKVLTMTFCWVTPEKFLSANTRGRVLDAFDAVGKWSMIDVYVLLLIMVGFGVSIKNPRLQILPEGFYGARVFVDPDVGLISFTAAAMLSLFLNNLLVYCHRNATEADKQINLNPELALHVVQISEDYFGQESDERRDKPHRFSTWLEEGGEMEEIEPLQSHVFLLANGKRLRFSLIGRRVVKLLLVFDLMLLVFGTFVASYGFRMIGVIGMFLDVDKTRSWMPYSVWDTFLFGARQSVESETNYAGFVIGVLFLCLSYLSTAFFLPLLQLISLFRLWKKPMTLKQQKWVYLTTEIFAAWSCIDVFIVGLIIAVLEMGHISYVLLEPVCKHVLPYINDVLIPSGFVEEEDATCLYIASSLEPGCALLLTCAFLTNVLSQLILRVCHHAIHQREAGSQQHLSSQTPGCFLRLLIHFGIALNCLEWVLEEQQGQQHDDSTTVAVSARQVSGFLDQL